MLPSSVTAKNSCRMRGAFWYAQDCPAFLLYGTVCADFACQNSRQLPDAEPFHKEAAFTHENVEKIQAATAESFIVALSLRNEQVCVFHFFHGFR